MYAAEIVDGVVARVIVGDAAWAEENLGGTWVPADDPYPGPGWAYTDGTFHPPVYPDLITEDDL